MQNCPVCSHLWRGRDGLGVAHVRGGPSSSGARAGHAVVVRQHEDALQLGVHQLGAVSLLPLWGKSWDCST